MTTRNRRSAKDAGARLEQAVADYLAKQLDDDRIERRTQRGTHDRGDIGGLRTVSGGRVVVECKNYGGQIKAGPWLDEAETERGNDDAVATIVVAKRRLHVDPADQIVLMTLRDFVAMLTGQRSEEDQ